MSKLALRGTITALATPFKADLSIDFDKFKKLIDYQIEGGVEAIVVCGSTGESATLSTKEKVAVITQAVEYSAGRIPIIAGTGSNDTSASIDMTVIAKEHGADAVLLVAPYYNKPTQEGLYYHYLSIAEAVDIPQIIYNVPGRSGVNILAETQLRLAEDCVNIIGTKEASANIEQMMQIIKYSPDNFTLLSGDDYLALPVILLGGRGVIAVISNYAPRLYSDAIRAALDGNYDFATDVFYKLFELMKLNFIEPNPIPAKAALSLLGLIEENYRLPLTPIQDKNRELIKAAMIEVGLMK